MIMDSPFEDFLPELLSIIFSFVHITDLAVLRLVCKKFHRKLFEDRLVWKFVCLQWWNEKGFDRKVKDTTLELVVEECSKFDASRDWVWFAKAFAREHFKDREGQRISIGELSTVGHLHKFGVEIACDGTNFYMGTFSSGRLHGRGYIWWRIGDRFEGEWSDGQRTGWGFYIWPNGNQYEGNFKNGQKDGPGMQIYNDGDRYEGEWGNNDRNGKGVFHWKDGSKYAGEWKDNQREGRGIQTWKDGGTYIGEWKADKRDGNGITTLADGSRFEGEWESGERHGWNIMEWANGFQFQGIFVRGLPDEGECLHPQIKEGIQKTLCTLNSVDGGQFYFECNICDQEFCTVCKDYCHKHLKPTPQEIKWNKRWGLMRFCDCTEMPNMCKCRAK